MGVYLRPTNDQRQLKHENQKNGPVGLDVLSVVVEVLENVVVGRVEDGASDLADVRKNVTSRGRILASLRPRG